MDNDRIGANSATSTDSPARLLIRLLLLEQRAVDPVAFLDPVRAAETLTQVAPADRVLFAAAAALSAGEPKRALRLLDATPLTGDAAAIAGALRRAAFAIDRNWSPGGTGAVLSQDDMATFAATNRGAAPTDPDLQVVVFVADDLLPMLPSLRSIVGDAVRTGRSDVVATVLASNAEVANRVLATGFGPLIAWHAICTADLLYRARDFASAAGPLATAQAAGGGDLAALAHMSVVWGDWQAEPLSNPDVLGLSAPPIGSISFAVDRDPATARQSYLQAAQAYAAAGSARGQGAVALRLAHLARHESDSAARDQGVAEARSLAAAAGDAALERLAEVHAVIDRVADGADEGAADIDVIADWVTTDGSTSWGRGLVRLLLDQAMAWRQSGEFIAARRALRLAERLADRLGTTLERPMVDRSVADLYGGANYRRASLVLTDLELEAALGEFDPAGPDAALEWAQLVDRAMTVHRDAVGLADPDLIAASAERLDRLASLAPAPADDGGVDAIPAELRSAFGAADGATPQEVLTSTLRSTRAQADVLIALYRGRIAQRDGRLDAAAADQAAALAGARAQGDALLECIALAHARRFEDAREIATRLFREGQLPPDLAASILVQVEAPELAEEAIGLIDAAGGFPPSARPWEGPGLRAEVQLGLGRLEDAVATADGAIAAFESRRARLARDILRTSAGDDSAVAGLYHVGILARLRLSEATAAAGDLPTARRLALEALDLADRLRGSVLSVVEALDALGDDPAARRAARRWLRAGSAWGASFEELADLIGARGRPDGPARVRDPGEQVSARERLELAEEELDDAEEAVAAIAPGVIAARAEAAPRDSSTVELDLSSAVPADALLLATYTYADDLVIWAVGTDRVRHHRATVPASDLAGRVRRLHAACAERAPVPEGVAEDLAALLLEPFADEIEGARRIVIVPHGGLTLLPFHALPFGSDVLGAARSVSYLPSAALLRRPAGAERPRLDAGGLVVGDPAYAADRGLTPLPGTATEAREVARILATDALLQGAATEDAVVAGAPDRPVLHLATHGFVDGARPNLSYVALAGDDALTVGDVMGLDASADLVVLSACHTARGSATAGGDLVGLVRAAVAAGAKHLVVSLWPVDDEAGCLTVCDFYQRLAAGGAVADALAGAQGYVRGLDRAGRRAAYEAICAAHGAPVQVADGPRDMGGGVVGGTIDVPRHPYHWAPFIHVGLP